MTYHDESTIFPVSNTDQKLSMHVNLSTASNDQKFKMNVTASYLLNNRHIPKYDLTTFLNTPPDAPPIYNPDGSLNWSNSTWSNPVATTEDPYIATTNNLVSNATLSYNILKGLYIKSNFGYTDMQVNETSEVSIISQDPAYSPTGSTNFSNNNIHSWIVEPQLSYSLLAGKSQFALLAGSTFEENSSNGLELYGSGYTSDLLLGSVLAAPILHVANLINSTYKYSALFGRVNYNYDEKYILNLNWRKRWKQPFRARKPVP